MQKPVYCLPELNLMPSISDTEAAEGSQENGTNDAALWAKNTSGPSSKLHAPNQNNRSAASQNIPS